GEGQLVESTMVEAALNAAADQVLEWQAYGRLLARDGNRGPVAAPQNLYACRGQEQWLALAVVTDEQWHALVGLLGRPSWAADPVTGTHELPGLPMRFSDVERCYRSPAPTLGQHTEEVLRELLGLGDDAIAELRAEGIAGERPAGV